jgi:protein-L-isoaspartate(D-aspartate) O-methyltransferase
MASTDFAENRRRMVDRDIAGRGITDPGVVAALGKVPREAFVPAGLVEYAYDDSPLPIAEGQTISQPYMVALMMEAAECKPGDRVLEIGTGSGYSAAALAEMGCEVFTIDRHPSLVEAAGERLRRLGHGTIHLKSGDGTLGWPEKAPFDAIIVTAGGPEIPDTLSRQLRTDGRLVIPVGREERFQRLIVRRRIGEDSFEDEDLGSVAFVPLIGAHGWKQKDERAAERRRSPALPADTVGLIRAAAEALPDLDDPRFGRMFDRIADQRVVLLGEASHGTSEFYRARARITERLIREHGFTIVAVEADWPDAAHVDRYIGHRPQVGLDEPAFSRFPTWMWRNEEVEGFVEWLRRHNATIPDGQDRVGFYGLDLYSLRSSVAAVLDYLDRHDPEAARLARERYGCLSPWQRDPASYGEAALSAGFKACEKAVLEMLRELLKKRLSYLKQDGADWLDVQQNARLIAAAEEYYRTLYYGSTNSWNLRDRHMFETLQAVMAARGPQAKAVVWAHNSHLGNAAATEVGRYGELNVGQLCREAYGVDVALVGFSTDRGTVAAASDWDGPMEVKQVRPSLAESYENLCARTEIPSFLLDLRRDRDEALITDLKRQRLERAIGVIYRPETERQSHYFYASLPDQFDLWAWFAETTAVKPLPGIERHDLAETWPFGV